MCRAGASRRRKMVTHTLYDARAAPGHSPPAMACATYAASAARAGISAGTRGARWSRRAGAGRRLPGVRAAARLLRRQGLVRRHDRVVLVLAVDVLVQQ